MQCWQGSSSSHQESLPPRPLVYRAPEGGSFDFLCIHPQRNPLNQKKMPNAKIKTRLEEMWGH
jgi:hypothetical protein